MEASAEFLQLFKVRAAAFTISDFNEASEGFSRTKN